MENYEIIRISEIDKNKFINSWEMAFSRKLDSSIYRWIFNNKNIIYALTFNGVITAGYCLYPLSCILHGKRSIALLCNNVFVNPDFKGRRLFEKIGQLALQDAGINELGSIAYGVPNPFALPGHKRVGWSVQNSIPFLEKESCKENNKKANWLLTLTEGERRGIARCSEASAINRNFSIIKTEEFLTWRFENKPGNKYWYGIKRKGSEVVAYAVCKYYAQSGVLHFVDIDGVDSQAVTELIEEAFQIPEDFCRVNIWESTAHKQQFIDAGFIESDEKNEFILITPKSLSKINIESDFNFVLADNDVY
tara:strand:+ start:7492 stop:8412 length:921 start_codon:yes stop_codon:yes gene_type:complete